MYHRRKWVGVLLLAPLVVMCGGCAWFFDGGGGSRTHRGTSLVRFLYPGENEPLARQGVPHLALPLRVGIAFVPEEGQHSLSEGQKVQLLEKVSSSFQQHPLIQGVERIPSTYLMPGGGFGNLDQLRQLYGIDVIALVSYDQVQHVDPTLFSLTYWTVVGAYIVPGDINDTSTMIDAAVFHIPSRKLLFRAPGTSRIDGMSAVAHEQRRLREASEEGFRQASAALVPELHRQLVLFQERVKRQPEQYVVSYRPGYSGGGAVDGFFVVGSALIVLGGLVYRRRNK